MIKVQIIKEKKIQKYIHINIKNFYVFLAVIFIKTFFLSLVSPIIDKSIKIKITIKQKMLFYLTALNKLTNFLIFLVFLKYLNILKLKEKK